VSYSEQAQVSDSLLGDPERLQRLDGIDRPDAFEAELGRPSRPGPLRPPLGTAPLGNWMPLSIAHGPDGWRTDLTWAGERPFSQPFSEQDLLQWSWRPLGRHLRPWLDLDGLIAAGEALEAPAPAGLIFHISRCGSTLLTRMLGAMDGVVALSEAPPLEALISAGRSDPSLDEHSRLRALRAAAALMGRPRPGPVGRSILKFDSWSLFDLPFIRQAFPRSPVVILHRDPLAVLASHQRMPGLHMVPGLIDWRCDPPAGSIGEYRARLLGALCEAALEAASASPDVRVMSYDTLVDLDPCQVAALFNLDAGARDQAAMSAVRAMDAKAPDDAFRPRSDPLDPAVIDQAGQWAHPAWRRLAALG
jgi:hypothetical protein